MPPTLFLIGADGPVMFLPQHLADDGAKDDFATTVRLMCIVQINARRTRFQQHEGTQYFFNIRVQTQWLMSWGLTITLTKYHA